MSHIKIEDWRNALQFSDSLSAFATDCDSPVDGLRCMDDYSKALGDWCYKCLARQSVRDLVDLQDAVDRILGSFKDV